MASGNAIRGNRVGAGPMGEAERGELLPACTSPIGARTATKTRPSFAQGPAWWRPSTGTAPAVGCLLARTARATPAPPKVEPYKTHLAYVKERRSDADGQAILNEALGALRQRGLISRSSPIADPRRM